MIQLQLINADIIYDTAIVTSRLFRRSFNCRDNPEMDYDFCLLTLKSSEKWRFPLFGAKGNFNHQILPYGIIFLAFINTHVFYLVSFKYSANLLRPWRFPLRILLWMSRHIEFLKSNMLIATIWYKIKTYHTFSIHSC